MQVFRINRNIFFIFQCWICAWGTGELRYFILTFIASHNTHHMVLFFLISFKYWGVWLYLLIMSCTYFKVNPHSIVAWMSNNSFLQLSVENFEKLESSQDLWKYEMNRFDNQSQRTFLGKKNRVTSCGPWK